MAMNDEIMKTTQFIFNKLEDTFQSFIFISNKEQTLNVIKDYKFNRIIVCRMFKCLFV